MTFCKRRKILRELMHTPASNFRRSTTRWPDYVEENFMILNDPIYGRIEVVCRNSKANQARLHVDREEICGATKLYRRLTGVYNKQLRYVLEETELIPIDHWQATERRDSWEFRHAHPIYGELDLRHSELFGNALLFVNGCKVGNASRLYKKLVAEISELRRSLMVEPWSRFPNDRTKFHCQVQGSMCSERYTIEERTAYGGAVVFSLKLRERTVITTDHKLWQRARYSAEQEIQRQRHKNKRCCKGKRKRN